MAHWSVSCFISVHWGTERIAESCSALLRRERLNTHNVIQHLNPELSPIGKLEFGEKGCVSFPLIKKLFEWPFRQQWQILELNKSTVKSCIVSVQARVCVSSIFSRLNVKMWQILWCRWQSAKRWTSQTDACIVLLSTCRQQLFHHSVLFLLH